MPAIWRFGALGGLTSRSSRAPRGARGRCGQRRSHLHVCRWASQAHAAWHCMCIASHLVSPTFSTPSARAMPTGPRRAAETLERHAPGSCSASAATASAIAATLRRTMARIRTRCLATCLGRVGRHQRTPKMLRHHAAARRQKHRNGSSLSGRQTMFLPHGADSSRSHGYSRVSSDAAQQPDVWAATASSSHASAVYTPLPRACKAGPASCAPPACRPGPRLPRERQPRCRAVARSLQEHRGLGDDA